MVALTEFQAYACIHHIFSIAEAATDREHRVFIRAIVCTERHGTCITVVAIACCKVRLILRFEIERMECGESSCPCTDLVHTIVQLID